ncbi:amino acid adenylation domain-containing protein [Paenibacillus sp. DS2015]|uniref:amino acid adenylation domain-containing protein n=1 Tax=Paenibacillus sp. DS2015 TaxID=3373917 RepID=UPI003D221E6B
MLIYQHFLLQVSKNPSKIAISMGDRQLSYDEFYNRCIQLAKKLAAHLPPKSRICIHMHKSDRFIELMFACLLSGITYIPIDPRSPIERARFIVEDSHSKIVFLDQQTKKIWSNPSLESSPGLQVEEVLLDDFIPILDEERKEMVIPVLIEQDDLAYILYTSGSTGKPKGVMISHKNASTFVNWGMDYFPLTEDDKIAIISPLHFDLCVLDIFVGLGKGATIYPVDESTVFMPEAMFRFLKHNRITLTYTVPTAYISLIKRSTASNNSLPDLKYILYAGEAFPPEMLANIKLIAPAARIFNMYGPVETNIITVHEVDAEDLSKADIPIGSSVVGAAVFLVDDHSELIEQSDKEGQIWVSGPSVSAGYLNLPSHNENFQKLIVHQGITYHCYNTGDYGWRDSDHNLHYVGRRDFLVKTRGFRVELGEVESILLNHNEVVEAAVVAVPHRDYTHLLIAHIILRDTSVEISDIQKFCQLNMPSYMIPWRIIVHEQLPKTTTGKISRVPLRELSLQYMSS